MDGQPTWNLDNPILWTPELMKCLEESEYKVSKVVDHWIDSISGGFITEFAIDMSASYSEVEHQFFKGPRGEYMKSLKTWIKILLCEK